MKVNIIPLAGEGRRFLDVGYLLPKPLIPVSGKPMIIQAIRGMPKADKWIFIVRKEHIDNYFIDELIKSEIKDAIIIVVEKTTEGQARTAMLAQPYLKPEDSVFIAACDNTFLINEKEYEKLTKDENVDAIVWTFTKLKSLKDNPTAYGWTVLDDDKKTIKDMSVKIPVSDDPYNDRAVCATFFFRRAKDFIDAVNLMIKENYRIKNEFYIDSVPIFLKKLNKRSVIFDVDLYVGWNVPADLYQYQKWEYLCSLNKLPKIELTEEGKKQLPLWKRYFERLRNA